MHVPTSPQQEKTVLMKQVTIKVSVVLPIYLIGDNHSREVHMQFDKCSLHTSTRTQHFLAP